MGIEKISEKLDQYCNKIVNKYQIPGFAIGFANNGELLWEKGFGSRNLKENLPVTSDTVFGIGSVTKSFTCVAIMQLQEAGKLSVHDPIIKYIPEFKTPEPNKTQQITIHHFMTHSSGIPPLPFLFGGLKRSMENDPKVAESKEELEKEQQLREFLDKTSYIETKDEYLAIISEAEYEFLGEPGEEFSYSNDGFSLLGIIIERVSGQQYEDYLKQNILDPIGMKNSVFHLNELIDHKDVAVLYADLQRNNEKVVYESNNPWDAPVMRAAGFLKSTVNDMLKYAEIFRNSGKVNGNQVLSKKSVKDMMMPYIECSIGRYYGYGLMITPDFFGYKLVEHGGAIKGVAAQMNIIPELNLTGVSLANLGGVASYRLLHSAFNDYLGKDVTSSHLNLEQVELEPDTLKEYTGTFKSEEGDQVTISINNGKLHAVTEEFSTELIPIGDDQFSTFILEEVSAIRFIKDQEGAIIRVLFGFRQLKKVE